jgi:hypothetical protein
MSPRRETPLQRKRQQRQLRQARKRRYQDRANRGVICAQGVEVDDAVVNFLITLRWLPEAEAADARCIGAAITRMLSTSARAKN